MSEPTRRYVALGFASVHDALNAESALKEAGITVTVIPSPRELGEICGIALRIEPEDADEAERALARSGVQPRARAGFLDR